MNPNNAQVVAFEPNYNGDSNDNFSNSNLMEISNLVEDRNLYKRDTKEFTESCIGSLTEIKNYSLARASCFASKGESIAINMKVANLDCKRLKSSLRESMKANKRQYDKLSSAALSLVHRTRSTRKELAELLRNMEDTINTTINN